MLKDGFQRKIEYLRLSVTDLCNIRCNYCMPLVGVRQVESKEILSFEEITRLVRAFVNLGVKSVRITGGEPLARKDLAKLITMLKEIPQLNDLCMTSNAILLKRYAKELKQAGLDRINIHLDTLNPQRFKQVTRWGNIQDVLAGISAAKNLGFNSVKINTVLQKGINDHELVSLVQFAAQNKLTIRFIELMPIGPGLDLSDHFLSAQFAIDELSKQFTLVPYEKRLGRGPAEYFKIVELDSVIGFIHPVSKPFCDKCNRVRISANGRFQDCLAYEDSYHLRDLLRDDSLLDEAIEERIKSLITFKREDHGGFRLPECTTTKGMYGIGG